MGEDEKMFKIGMWALMLMFLLTVALQVCYRTQNRTRKMIRHEIASVEKQMMVEQGRYETFTRPEFLRDKVLMINPNSETVGYSKNVFINELEYNK